MSEDTIIDLGDCALIKLKYKIHGEVYILTEATGDVACKRSNKIFQAATFAKDGQISMVNSVADLEPWLVSQCLVKESTMTHVPEEVVRGWSAKIQKRLYNDLIKISELDAETEAEDKSLKEEQTPAEEEGDQGND